MRRRYLADFEGKDSRNVFWGCLIACVLFATAAQAEDDEAAPPPAKKPAAPAASEPAPAKTEEKAAAEAEKKKETVKTGVIASQVSTGSHATVAVDADTTTAGGSPGEESNVITGSVVRSGSEKCIAKVTNNGQSTYSISFVVEGTNARGGKSLKEYYSATIKPKETVEKAVPRCDKNLNLAVVLKSARALK